MYQSLNGYEKSDLFIFNTNLLDQTKVTLPSPSVTLANSEKELVLEIFNEY